MPDAKQIVTCPSYNGWGYGLESPYAYFSDLSAEEIKKRYATRDVFYLCGANDRDPNDDTIGTSCGASRTAKRDKSPDARHGPQRLR